MSDNNTKSVIEALLFASEKPVMLEQIKKALDNLDSEEIKRLIAELKSDYENSGRGMRIVEVAGGYQMTTFPGFATFLRKMYRERQADRLSRPALETLAIIAYKQPLTRTEIESLRNVNVDGVMKSLTDKFLIRITGRKKVAGRPFVYGTTRQFLEHFGLKSLDELPKMENFTELAQQKEQEQIETISEEKTEVVNEPQQTA
ncbi:MAG: SMC-Scp complex subunit ScpB [Candidatus Omnitrophica bacterium]|nr:SMC-Scp complex subunit ScpB [Candidatus Omnitrophota bacterium]